MKFYGAFALAALPPTAHLGLVFEVASSTIGTYRLNASQVRDVIKQVLIGLDFLHNEMSLVHRGM